MRKFKINNGQPYPLGATVKTGGTNFSMVNTSGEECGIIFYKKGVEIKERVFFDQKHRIGNICCAFVENVSEGEYEYNFFIGDRVFVDPHARKIVGNEKWRSGELKRPFLRGGICAGSFDWQGTAPLHIPYSESIMYCLNVRSYTKHSSSKVKHKGTFEGLVEKIPYIKGLGVNSVELMPAYEFEECEWDSVEAIAESLTIEYQVGHIAEELPADKEPQRPKRLNCWGYKEAFYYAPKASYCASGHPCTEFRHMVREFHKNGIEIIMQFYFPENIKQGFILDIIKYWVLEYHIDGVHLKGTRLPVTLLATEPLLARTKILCEDFYLHEIYPDGEAPAYRTLGYYRDIFMYDIRRYLKGDPNMLKSFQHQMRNFSSECGVINYITNYYGFTLNDLVSYEYKHNEANGENNSDGTENNFSWNCGEEGPSRKKNIRQLRLKQMKNAMSFLFTAQGTPLLFAGDEFGNSQNGNNNCYCQDNETGWVNWGGMARNSALYEYTKELIAFRKNHPMLHLEKALTMLDRYGCGYPDLSYHGEEAWKVQLAGNDRHIGIMYCGQGEFLYIAYNMHWITHSFALPSIADHEWVMALGTEDNNLAYDEDKKTTYVDIKPRSIALLTGRKRLKPGKKGKAAKPKGIAEKTRKRPGAAGMKGSAAEAGQGQAGVNVPTSAPVPAGEGESKVSKTEEG